VLGALACGGNVAGNNGAGPTTFTAYSCSGWNESGPEVAFTFTAPADGNVTLTLSNLGADLDLFVLAGGCDAAQCVAYGDNNTTFWATAGETYHVLVDGYMGAVSDFTLTATCN